MPGPPIVLSTIDVAGMTLRRFDIGPEAPAGLPLLYIGGHTSRLEAMFDLAHLLAAERRVVAVEMPGCGESSKPDRRYDLRFYEDTLVAAMDAMGIDRAVPVGGSLGGNLTLRLGHRFPDRFPVLAPWAPGSAWAAKPRLAKVTARFGRRMFWPTVWVQSRFWYERSWPGREAALAETFDYYRTAMSPGFIRMYWGMAADQVGRSLFDLAPSITQPTLMVWGDRDHGAGMGKGVARLVELLPDAQLVVIERARHSLESEVPERLGEIVLGFLREQPLAG